MRLERVGFMGALYVRLYCLVQVDIKIMVAYSSVVVYINFMVASLFSLLKVGVISTIVVMISHESCSSGLFYMVNIFYIRSHRRLIIMNKGCINYIPVVIIWWFFFIFFKFFSSFFIKFYNNYSFIGNIILILFIRLICFLRVAYSLYLFSIVTWGGF